MSDYKAVGGRFFNLPLKIFMFFVTLMVAITGYRLFFGLGAVTDLNGGYPWGVWIAFDLLVGTGFACGGWALALLVYVCNQNQFHPLIRSAVLASLFGYCLGGFAIIIDMGRWWNVPNIFFPWQMNVNSVLIATSICMAVYCLILILEFAPSLVQKFKLGKVKAVLDKWMFVILAIGALLPAISQSSMGILFMIAGDKIHPLWQSYEMLGLFALLTAFIMGFSIVIFEGSLISSKISGHDNRNLFRKLTAVIKAIVLFYFICRFGELAYRDKLAMIFSGDFYGNMFLLEQSLFALPLVVLWSKSLQSKPQWLFVGAVSMLAASALYRLNYALIAYTPGNGYQYFPTATELLFSVGLISLEVIGFIWLIKWSPVLPKPHESSAASNAADPLATIANS